MFSSKMLWGSVFCLALLSTATLVANAPEDLTKCIVANQVDRTLFKFGEASVQKNNPSLVGFWKAASCGHTGLAYYFSGDRSDQNRKVFEQTKLTRAFRIGMYSTAAPVTASAYSRTKVGEIATFMEGMFQRRIKAVSCGFIPSETVAEVSQLDELFMLASMGSSARLEDMVQARTMIKELAVVISSHQETDTSLNCGQSLMDRFLADVKQIESFAKRSHPWAPNCGVSSDGGDLVLQCLPLD